MPESTEALTKSSWLLRAIVLCQSTPPEKPGNGTQNLRESSSQTRFYQRRLRCKSESKIRQSLLPCQHFPLKLGRHWSEHCSQIPEPRNHRTWRVKQVNHRNRYSTSAFEQPGPKGMKRSPAELTGEGIRRLPGIANTVSINRSWDKVT